MLLCSIKGATNLMTWDGPSESHDGTDLMQDDKFELSEWNKQMCSHLIGTLSPNINKQLLCYGFINVMDKIILLVGI